LDSRKSSAFVPHDIAATIRGSGSGPLAGLTVAVKDMYDIAGNAPGRESGLARGSIARKQNAAAINRLLAAGADIIGKTVCDEFFFSLTGANAHYGTPVNVRAPGRFPGGSSSGSAACIAAGACDIALGSDTGGSVRVPGGFCGIYGIRPTHGRVDAAGAMTMAPTFDTVGWFAHSPGILRKAGAVLLERVSERREPISNCSCCETHSNRPTLHWPALCVNSSNARHPNLPRRRMRSSQRAVSITGAIVFEPFRGARSGPSMATWIEAHRPRLGPGIRERMAYAATISQGAADAALEFFFRDRADIRARISPGTIAALPSVPCISPRVDSTPEVLDAFRSRTMALTSIAGIGGLPQITIPSDFGQLPDRIVADRLGRSGRNSARSCGRAGALCGAAHQSLKVLTRLKSHGHPS